MDQSQRAVQSYWWSWMADGVTTEDICELICAFDANILKGDR
jgi:hypothetical protein